MPPSHRPLPESIQARFESLSMRLDASTDYLLQIRETLVNQMEQQVMQLEETRRALHETALETRRWADQLLHSQVAPVPLAPPQIPELTDVSLPVQDLAPLPEPASVAPPVDPPQESLPPAPVKLPNVIAALFDSPPKPSRVQLPSPRSAPVPEIPAHVENWAPMGPMEVPPVLVTPPAVPVSPSEPLPNPEKSTLEELNDALAHAFSQISYRGQPV